MKTRYPNVTVNADRHGKLRARYRKAGRAPVYMKTLPDQPGFEQEYRALVDNREPVRVATIPGSVNDLVARYYRSGDFAAAGSDTHRQWRRSIIERFRGELGNDQVSDFRFEHIEALLIRTTRKQKTDKGRTVGGEVAARNLRKELRRLFAYAVKLGWIKSNPVELAGRIGKSRLTGFHDWTEEEIARYQATHSIGTKARLALELLLWTGARRSDAQALGPRNIVGDRIVFRASKNGASISLPIAPDLRRAIDATRDVGIATFLINDHGKPFTKAGFGNRFRKWCDDAGLPHCTAHGLRKAITRRMAESGASQQMMKAVGGWKNDEEVALYSAGAEQKSLASAAIGIVIDGFKSKDNA